MRTMKMRAPKKARRSEEGIALLVALFALLLLSAIAMGMMNMANTETAVTTNYRDAQAAFFASQAGLQEARIRIMSDDADNPKPLNVQTGTLVPSVTPTTMPTAMAPTGVVYIVNPLPGENIQPWSPANAFADTELCKERFALTGGDAGYGNAGAPCDPAATLPGGVWYTAVNSIGGSAGLTGYKWVRVTRKKNKGSTPYPTDGNTATALPDRPVCWDGTNQFLLPAAYATCELIPRISQGYTSVFVLTSLAVTATGGRRMTQMEIAIDPPMITNAAVDSEDHVVLNGQLTVNGYDYCSCQPLMTCNNNGDNPGSGTKQCLDSRNPRQPVYVDRTGKDCDESKWAIYSKSQIDNPNSSQNIYGGPTTTMGNQQLSLSPNNTNWPYDINALIETYKSGSQNAATPGALNIKGTPYNMTCTADADPTTPDNCGTNSGAVFGVPPAMPPSPPDNPTYPVTVPPAQQQPQSVYIPGSVKLTGNSQGNGILIVDGDLEINGGFQFYGLILVRGVISFTGGGAQGVNIYGAVLAGQQSIANIDTTLGGSAVINFDQCSLNRKMTPRPPRMLATREMMY